jgi:hypothetical protein
VNVSLCRLNSEQDYRDELAQRKISLQNHRYSGDLLERENSLLKEQVQRMSQLLENDSQLRETRARSFVRSRNPSHYKKSDTTINTTNKQSAQSAETTNSLTQTLLEMRENQIMKLQAEIEEKSTEIRELKTKLIKQAQRSSRELSGVTGRLSEFEGMLSHKDQQIIAHQKQFEYLYESLENLQNMYESKTQNDLKMFVKLAYIWSSLFLDGRVLLLLLTAATFYYL